MTPPTSWSQIMEQTLGYGMTASSCMSRLVPPPPGTSIWDPFQWKASMSQAEAGTEEEWRRDRPVKHCQSSPRRWEARSTYPFPLQDNGGRHKAVQQLYQHAGECTPAHHNVAAEGMTSHHPDLESGLAKSLNNQVLYMISEYHLTYLS